MGEVIGHVGMLIIAVVGPDVCVPATIQNFVLPGPHGSVLDPQQGRPQHQPHTLRGQRRERGGCPADGSATCAPRDLKGVTGYRPRQ